MKINYKIYFINLFLTIHLLNTFDVLPIRLGQFLLLFIGILLLIFILIEKKRLMLVYSALAFILFCTFIGIITYIFTENANLLEYLWPFGYFGVAISMVYSKIGSKYPMYLAVGLIIFYLSQSILGHTPNEFSSVTSRNNISSNLLFFIVLIILYSKVSNKFFLNVLLILSLYISLWAGGRAGIISIFSFLIFINVIDYKAKKLFVYKPSMYIGGIIAAVTIYFLFKENLLEYYQIFDSRGFESIRTDMWSQYINASTSNLKSLLFSARLSDIPIIALYNNNIHNSFLHMYSRYGIIVLALIIIILIKTILIQLRTKNYLLLIVLVSISIRSIFDLIAFNGIFDVIYYYLIIQSIMLTKEYQKGCYYDK